MDSQLQKLEQLNREAITALAGTDAAIEAVNGWLDSGLEWLQTMRVIKRNLEIVVPQLATAVAEIQRIVDSNNAGEGWKQGGDNA